MRQRRRCDIVNGPPVGLVCSILRSNAVVMDRWKLWLLPLLPLCWCLDSKVIVGKGPDVTPICTNKPQSIFTVECQISTQKTKDEKCLLYQHAWGFVKQCDARFTLTQENQTVFLRLTSLTPVDSGNYTCVCSLPEKTHVLQLNITVEGEDGSGSSGTAVSVVVVLIVAAIVVAGLVLGYKLREEDWRQLMSRLRDRMRSEAPDSSVCAAPCSWNQDDQDDDYKTLQHSTDDLYQNMSSIYHQDKAKRHLAGNYRADTHLEDEIYEVTNENEEIYENLGI